MAGKIKILLGASLTLLSITIAVIFMLLGDFRPQRALSSACDDGNLQHARLAIALGADINAHPGGRSPNIVAAGGSGQIEVIKFLLERGVKIETKDKFGGTALLRASQNGQTATVKYLLDQGADPNVEDKEGGNTALDFAVQHREVQVMTLLQKAGAKSHTMN